MDGNPSSRKHAMFMPRHSKPLPSAKAVATLVVQQRQQSQAVDKHVLIVEEVKPAAAPPVVKQPSA